MDLKKIERLVEIFEASDLAEMEIREEDDSIRLSRASAYASPMPAAYPAAAAPAATTSVPAVETKSEESVAETPEGHVVRSPMVGTFYAAPNPDSDPFVSVGQTVRAGDTVCVIEAMKMFNQIEADVEGKVVAVLVENAQPVEFDQPLLIIR